MSTLRAIEIKHCQAGSVTSRSDGSVKLSFVTPELRPSESGALILLHGKNVCLSIVPEDAPPAELVRVDTERQGKTPGQRLRAVLFVLWQTQGQRGPFETFYDVQMENYINAVKEQLP